MRLPPWYRPRTRPLAEALLTLDFSRATGIGPLEPGLSVMWDTTPIRCASDPSHEVLLIVDDRGHLLTVKRGREPLAAIRLRRDTKRIGTPLRAVCQCCGRLCYRLYLYWLWHPRCGKCLRVTYSSGQGEPSSRIAIRMQRLQHRLESSANDQRGRGRTADIDET